MKLVVSFYGMCLCVLDARKGSAAKSATVLLLNGAAPPTRAAAGGPGRLPFHHPLLFVPTKSADLKRTSWSPVPAADTMVDTENLVAGRAYAWNLAGLDLTLGHGKGVTLFQNQDEVDGRLPDPANPDNPQEWLDWRRIPNLARIAPGSRLRRSYRAIGREVLGIVRFSGGELRGATPKNPAGVSAPWRFSDTYEQVITDRFEFHCEVKGSELKAAGFAGGPGQKIRLTDPGKVVRLSVVHEASKPDVELLDVARPAVRAAAAAPELPHYHAFYEAIQGPNVEALRSPMRGNAVAGGGGGGRFPVIDTPTCPPAAFPQP
jgi:hypothetical protein